MKRCNACGEEFEDQFTFCPIDGISFGQATPTNNEFSLTLISDARLTERLANELRFVIDQLKRAWPLFKRDPIKFSETELSELRNIVKRALMRPYVVSASMAAMLFVFTIVLGVLLLEKHSAKPAVAVEADDIAPITTIDFQTDTNNPSKSGIGAGAKGRVGFDQGKGEGSRPVAARSRGGGSGGDHDRSVPSLGRLPQPSVIPAPIPTTYARLPPQALPAAGIDIDPALWKNLAFTSYGDPRSKSVVPSNGPGEGGGVGTNSGTGIGEGSGPGFGPGNKGNMGGGDKSPGCCGSGGSRGDNPNYEPDRVYKLAEITTRARVLSKPEPQYTEEARRNQITGTVILSVVFSKSGQVTNIRAVQSLQGGLTEKAIAAARLIRFVPATRNGQPVSMYMQLEYNFNLY